jgi:hypothetical protein
MMRGGVNHGTSPSHITHNNPRGAIFQNPKILKKFFSKPRLISIIYQTPLSLLFLANKMNNKLKIKTMSELLYPKQKFTLRNPLTREVLEKTGK